MVEDLGLEPFDTSTSFRLHTLVGNKNSSANVVKFNVQSLETEELFCDVIAVVNPPWVDDVETLPHKQDLTNLQHLDNVKLFTLDDCITVDSGGQYRVLKYHGTFLVPLTVSSVLGTEYRYRGTFFYKVPRYSV